MCDAETKCQPPASFGEFNKEDIEDALSAGVNIGMRNVEVPRWTGDFNFNQEKALKESKDYLTTKTKS